MARIEQSTEINVPARTAYDQLLRFEQYPRFMEDVEQVRQRDDAHVHWRTKAGNLGIEWDAEITQQVPEQCIAWRNTSEPHYAGKIELQALAQDKTRITVSIDAEHGQHVLAQHGDAERAIAQRVERGLARFKKIAENLRHESAPAQAAQPAGADKKAESAEQPQQRQVRQTQPDQSGEQQQVPAGEQERSWIANPLQMWDAPLTMMRKMSEEMDQLVGKFIGRPAQISAKIRGAAPSGTWAPAVEIAQSEDRMVICAELPGVRRDDVRVEIKNDRVTIEGNRQPARQAQELQRSERNYGHFYRVIALPEGAEPDAASAALHDGVLEITVPVPEGGKRARRVDIQPR